MALTENDKKIITYHVSEGNLESLFNYIEMEIEMAEIKAKAELIKQINLLQK